MYLKITVLAVLIAGIFSTPLYTTREHDTGPKECAKGPEYWCIDLPTAKSCGAVTHCIQDVWQHMNVLEDKNEICDTCKKMVKEARDQLLSNETQEELREVFEGTCHIYFPIKLIADECIKYVDEYIPDLVEMLASRMDPQLVCATAGLCNTEHIHGVLHTQKGKSRPRTPAQCQDCKTFITDTENIIKNHTKEQVEDKLLEICSTLATEYKSACIAIIRSKIDDIYNFLLNDLNPDEFCSLVGMCDETNRIPQIKSLIENFIASRDPDPECEFCEQMVSYIRDVLTSNTTEEEFKDMLLGICTHLGSMSDECEKIVNENFQEIYEFLTAELDPQLVCSSLGICKDERVKSVPMLTLMPAQLESNSIKDAPFGPVGDKLTRMDADKKNIFIKLPVSKKTPVFVGAEKFNHPDSNQRGTSTEKSNISCALCEYALHQLQEMLMDNKTEEAVRKALDNLCSELPQTLSDQCTKFVNDYGAAIMSLIAQDLDPSQICVQLKLCDNLVKLDVKTKFPFTKIKSSSMKKLESPIQNTIINAASAQLPPELYIPQALLPAELKRELEPLKETLDAASAQLPPERLLPQILVKSKVPIGNLKMDGCDTCQMVVDYIDKLLEEQEAESDITKVLEKVCNIVPPSAKDQCDTLVSTYGPYVLQLIGQLADSRKVCQAIELCSTPPGQVQLLGGKKCTYGPSYWCQSRFHAKACKAVKHCEDHVWKKE